MLHNLNNSAAIEFGGTIILTTIMRQQQDRNFIDILNDVRIGNISHDSLQRLNECCITVKPRPTDGIIPTKLYCTNKDVDKENLDRLAELPGSEIVIPSKDIWRVKVARAARRKQMVESMDKYTPNQVILKLNAQVMLLRNLQDQTNSAKTPELANGSRGVITGFMSALSQVKYTTEESLKDIKDNEVLIPIVKFDTGYHIPVHPVETIVQESANNEGVLVRLSVPLRLAW
jgi:hypothetical protein